MSITSFPLLVGGYIRMPRFRRRFPRRVIGILLLIFECHEHRSHFGPERLGVRPDPTDARRLQQLGALDAPVVGLVGPPPTPQTPPPHHRPSSSSSDGDSASRTVFISVSATS